MTIEEKAKAYDEAKARMSKACDEHRCSLYFMSEIFPEPKVPRDNDMKLTIIQFLEYASSYGCPDILSKEKAKTWIAWLEKQGGVDNVPLEGSVNTVVTDSKQTKPNHRKPRFNEGEWIIDIQDGEIFHINKALEYAYEVTNLKGGYFQISRCSIETSYKPWTIEDAKPGDVLAAHECLVLFKKLDGLNIRCYCTYHFMNNPSFYVDTLQNKDAFHPATKEQQDLLFQKMKEAGHTFDFEKKELKKIESKPAIEMKTPEESLGIDSDTYNKIVDECIYGEQKPAWSEEDEKTLNEIFSVAARASLRKSTLFGKSYDYIKWQNWLKSLRDRVQPQPKQEWSEEDEKIFRVLLKALVRISSNTRTDSTSINYSFFTEINWLKSLKERMKE